MFKATRKAGVNMEEIWKDIQGYEGLYQVSDIGNIKSLHYGVKANHPDWKSQPQSYLKQKIATSGYLRVELYKKDSRKCFYVHRLVANAFIDNPDSKPQVNHIDGNKLNNHVTNLEWVTRSENQKHAHKLGLMQSPMKDKKGFKNPRSKPLIQYNLNGEFIAFWHSASDVARSFGCLSSCISACANGRHLTSQGYIWRFYEGDSIPMQINV